MAGGIVIAVLLVLAPIGIVMSGVLAAAALGSILQSDRDAAFEGTEQYDLAHADPYGKA